MALTSGIYIPPFTVPTAPQPTGNTTPGSGVITAGLNVLNTILNGVFGNGNTGTTPGAGMLPSAPTNAQTPGVGSNTLIIVGLVFVFIFTKIQSKK